MRIAIFGAGGTGGYFGGRLALSGQQVIFIARGEHLKALQEQGLRVESIQGDFQLPKVEAVDDTSLVGPVDAVIVAVKTWQLPEAIPQIQNLVGKETLVVPILNGVEAPEQLRSGLKGGIVCGGLCQISSFVAAPGVIKHVAIKPYFAFGALAAEPGNDEPEPEAAAHVEQLRQALEQAGVWVEVPEDIQAAMWKKFVFIAAISGVGAVTRAPAGVIRSLPESRGLLADAIAEVAAIGRAMKIHLSKDIETSTLAFIDSIAPGTVASMQRDIMAGKPSELEGQTGAAVRISKMVSLPAPVNQYIYASLLPQEQKARGRVEF